MLFQQQQQLQLQNLCNFITSGQGITPAPAAPNAQGAFAGENAVACAGLQLLIATNAVPVAAWRDSVPPNQHLPWHNIHVTPICM
jgi:hypothetical protein